MIGDVLLNSEDLDEGNLELQRIAIEGLVLPGGSIRLVPNERRRPAAPRSFLGCFFVMQAASFCQQKH